MAVSCKKTVIGILTGSGDIPGLNPAIRAVTIRCTARGLQRDWGCGADGPALAIAWRDAEYDNSDNSQVLTAELVNRAGRRGGTFLHTSGTNPSKVSKASVPPPLQGTYPAKS